MCSRTSIENTNSLRTKNSNRYVSVNVEIWLASTRKNSNTRYERREERSSRKESSHKLNMKVC